MGEPKGPPSVVGEDVYPVHPLDSAPGVRKLFMAWTMRFNDVIDAEKLHRALAALLEIGDWRKLGGRLRATRNGNLEIHVPNEFTAELPAVAFTHDAMLDISIEQHPVASNLPRPTKKPSIQPLFSNLDSLAARPGLPTTMEEIICQNAPLLALHITSFKDATLVGLSWPHIMDAVGQQALLRAWSLVLAGREQQVPPVLGARSDILREALGPDGAAAQEESVLRRHRLEGFRHSRFFLRLLWDSYRSTAVQAKMIFIPRDAISRLHGQAKEEAARAVSGACGDAQPFVSEGDVLTAWAAQVVAVSEPNPRPVTLVNALNARYRLPQLHKPAGVHVQGMVLCIFTLLPSHVARGPLGPIALAHRQQLSKQATEQQVLSNLRSTYEHAEAKKGLPPLYGETSAVPVIFNNMTRTEVMLAADFGAAVVRQGDETQARSNPPGTMVYYHHQALGFKDSCRNCFVLYGKDRDGNYWLVGNLPSQAWEKAAESLEGIQV